MRDAFALAKEKQPAIIFIDELDAIGTKRFDSELSGDREVQRTMLELLNQVGLAQIGLPGRGVGRVVYVGGGLVGRDRVVYACFLGGGGVSCTLAGVWGGVIALFTHVALHEAARRGVAWHAEWRGWAVVRVPRRGMPPSLPSV